MLDLNKHIMEHLMCPFELGARDCATFAFDYVMDATGIDVLKEFRGYKSARDVFNLMQKHESKSIEEMLLKQIKKHFRETNGNGLFALCSVRQGRSFGLCDGNNVIAYNENGIEYVIDSNVICKWEG